MSSVVSFAMYFDAIVTLVKVGEMEKAFAVPSVTDRPATATSFGFWLSLSWCTSFSALLEKGGRKGKTGKCPFRPAAEPAEGHAKEMFPLSRAAAVCSLSLLALN